MADDKAKYDATFRLVVDTTIVTDIYIRRVMFVFDWFLANIVDPAFPSANFTRAVHVANKRSRAVAKSPKTTSAVPSTYTAPFRSTIYFSTDVPNTDAKRQETPVTPGTPGTTATIKPNLLWKSLFAASTRNSSDICQLHNTDIVLASSLPLDFLEFYHRLVYADKPANIGLIPILAFDPDHALWPENRCADIIFEMNDALTLRLDQTGTLSFYDEIIHILYQKHILDSSSGVRAYAFLHALFKNAKRQLNYKMTTPPDIEEATSIGSFGANLEHYYLQMHTMGVYFDDKSSHAFSFQPSSRKALKCSGSWIAWITSRMLIPCLSNSLSLSLSCGSKTFTPFRIFPLL
jgi:hypothetical protein